MSWSCWIKPFLPNLIILRLCRSRHTDGTYICTTCSVSIEWVLRSEIAELKRLSMPFYLRLPNCLFINAILVDYPTKSERNAFIKMAQMFHFH